MMFYILKNLINYQINLVTILTNLLIISIVTIYQFLNQFISASNQVLFHNRYSRRLNLRLRRLFAIARRRLKRNWNSILNYVLRRESNEIVLLQSNDSIDTNQSIFFSNKQNDHQILQIFDKMDLILNYVKFWPSSIRNEISNYVETRLYLEAEYASKILNHCQNARAQLNKEDELEDNFFDFRPVFMTTINEEFTICNEVIRNCELLLTSSFLEPLEDKLRDFNENLAFIKRKWNVKINFLQDRVIELRKSQKIYLKCALHFIKLTHSEIQNDEKDESYLKREQLYRNLLIKSENDYKFKINDVNKCLIKLERLKNQCLNEIQSLIDDASFNVRKLTINYITKLYPNQKNQLLNLMISIKPEIEFKNFVQNLKIPNLPHYSFTKYDQIKCD